MQSILKFLSALALCGAAAAASGSPAAPQNGVDYLTLAETQNTDAGSKVEVIEFFAYYCPHCYRFEPVLDAWVKKQGDKIVFRRVHVGHTAAVVPQQRLYYTLDALGVVPQYHASVFAAIHEQRQRMGSDEQVFAWAAKAGIDSARFTDVYRSFGTQAKLNRANAMFSAYKIESWPMVAIGGRYLTSPYQASKAGPDDASEEQQQQMALQVMDHLVAKAKAEQK